MPQLRDVEYIYIYIFMLNESRCGRIPTKPRQNSKYLKRSIGRRSKGIGEHETSNERCGRRTSKGAGNELCARLFMYLDTLRKSKHRDRNVGLYARCFEHKA